jgi:plasmid maintenance system killer protein
MSYPKTDEFFNQCMDVLTFDDESGEFFVTRTKGAHTWQEPAGTITTAGLRLTVNKTYVMAHHLVWRMKQKEWPDYQIKHSNGNIFDNRSFNLCAPNKDKPKQRQKQSTAKPFLLSLGYSEKQINRHLVETTRERFGESLALDLQLKLKMISAAEHEKRRLILEAEVLADKYADRKQSQLHTDEVKPLKMYTAESDN